MENKLDLTDLASLGPRLTPEYLAGFFDGEGSITSHGRGQLCPTVQVNITQTGQAGLLVMAAIATRFGGGPYEKKRPSHGRWKHCYQCAWTGSGAKAFLECIRPHVIIKKKMVEAALEFIDLLGKRGGDTPSQVNIDRRIELAGRITQLNDAARHGDKERVQ